MSLGTSELLIGTSTLGCHNLTCGHTSAEHPFSTNFIDRPCNVCDCKSFEMLTPVSVISDSFASLSNIQIAPTVTESSLKQQIDDLEHALEESHKEIGSLNKKLKQKNIKNKELAYIVGSLRIELQIVNDVKRNLMSIVDDK